MYVAVIIVALHLKEWKNSTIHVYKRIDKYLLYRMVGNFCEVLIFMFFASQKPIVKIKTVKFLLTKLTCRSEIHQPQKLKPRKFLKPCFPNICTCENYRPYRILCSRFITSFGWRKRFLICGCACQVDSLASMVEHQ